MNFNELWNNYFPIVSISRIGDKSDNKLYSMGKQFVTYSNGTNLLDIKKMAAQLPFSGLFPSSDDPAFKHWDKLDEELKKSKPVNIIKLFLKEEEKMFKKHYGKNIQNIDCLSELFIKEIINNHKWIFFNNTENTFKCDFSNIIYGKYKPNSIYKAFRCFVSRYYAYMYIKNPNDKDNIHIRNVIENIKENNSYFIPTEKYFKEMLINSMNLHNNLMNEWNYYKNIIYGILLDLNLNEKAEQLEAKAKDGVYDLVKYLDIIIHDPLIKEILEERINYYILAAKINEYKGNKISTNDPVKNKNGDGTKELIDIIKNNDAAIESILEDKKPSHNIYVDLPDDKLNQLRTIWLKPFIESYKNNEYSQNGQTNFATLKSFRRFIKWLIHEIVNKYQNMAESELFKDYCRVHELNGCIECIILAPIENKGNQIAQSINGNTYDINKCTYCFGFNNHINILEPHYDIFKRRLNRFYKQISGELR
ncbi:MAG: hypothetical protein FWD26_07895 [Treponema sp.]|nr:hypothetical protein [Treponema sp.]